jgi:hypothetical protein
LFEQLEKEWGAKSLLKQARTIVVEALRAQAAIAALPYNLERARGLEANEDARRERAVADAVRDADALMSALKGPV